MSTSNSSASDLYLDLDSSGSPVDLLASGSGNSNGAYFGLEGEIPLSVACCPSTITKGDRYTKESDQLTKDQTTESQISDRSLFHLSCKSDHFSISSSNPKYDTENTPKPHACNGYLHENTDQQIETWANNSLPSIESLTKKCESSNNCSVSKLPTTPSDDSKHSICSTQNAVQPSPVLPKQWRLGADLSVKPSEVKTLSPRYSEGCENQSIETMYINESFISKLKETLFELSEHLECHADLSHDNSDTEPCLTHSMIASNESMAVDSICSPDRNNCEYSYCSTYNRPNDLLIECSVPFPCNDFCSFVNNEESATVDDSDTDLSRITSGLVAEPSPVQDDDDNDHSCRVRRCSSLKTGKTPPGTPGRKKIVRFADVLGLDLADVRTFLDEIPKIPRSAYEDLREADLSLGSSAMPVAVVGPVSAKSGKCLVALFQQPGGQPDFLGRVREYQVCLESAVVSDTVTFSVAGTVRVHNLDFNKSVHVRYSLDGWQTFADLQATYLPNSCDGFSDKFSFLLFAHTLGVGQCLEFAVRFQCKGLQYWDSNQGTNYVFQCLPLAYSTPYLPLLSPDERLTSFY